MAAILDISSSLTRFGGLSTCFDTSSSSFYFLLFTFSVTLGNNLLLESLVLLPKHVTSVKLKRVVLASRNIV